MSSMTGKNSITSRQFNRGLLLQLIATQTCKSRIELSKTTGLSKMTVTNIVSEFMQQGLVKECEEELTEVCGRNPILLKISEKAPKILGLLISRDRIEAVVCTLTMEILDSERIAFTHLTEKELYEDCFLVLDRLLERTKNILGIGIAAIGPVHVRKGMILNPPRFYGIKNIKIVEVLKGKYELPVVLEHDNNSAALAEKLFGMGKNVQDFLFLGISNGIGCGIISNGKLYRGHRQLPPEIGHISIERKGVLCACGNRGCLELYADTSVVLQKLQQETGEHLSFSEFCLVKGNQIVDKIFEEMLEDISTGLVSAMNLFHPEMIVLGQDCMDWNERQVKELEEQINARKMVHDQKVIPVKKAYFGKRAQLAGAAANLAAEAFKGKLLFSGK